MTERSLFSQLLMFAVVGIVATATHYVVALLLHELGNVNIYAANFAGFCSAVTVSFIGHGVLTFQVRPQRRMLRRFLLVAIAAFFGSNALLAVLELGTDFSASMRLAIVVFVIPLSTFFANKIWVYRKLPEQPSE